jgi:hypothetical protein
MPRRALGIGDFVVVRRDCRARLRREQGDKLDLRQGHPITDVTGWNRRLLWLDSVLLAWPCEVRLADGPAERSDLRFEKMAREIEAMKAKRRAERRKGKK